MITGFCSILIAWFTNSPGGASMPAAAVIEKITNRPPKGSVADESPEVDIENTIVSGVFIVLFAIALHTASVLNIPEREPPVVRLCRRSIRVVR